MQEAVGFHMLTKESMHDGEVIQRHRTFHARRQVSIWLRTIVLPFAFIVRLGCNQVTGTLVRNAA